METKIIEPDFMSAGWAGVWRNPAGSLQPSTPTIETSGSIVLPSSFPGRRSMVVIDDRVIERSDWLQGGLRDLAASGQQLRTEFEQRFRIGGVASPEAHTEPGISPLDALTAIEELLGMTVEAAAAAVGIGRTTPMDWRRTRRQPRPSTVRQLWRLYGIAMGLKEVLGVTGTLTWLRVGEVSPLSLLEAGDLDGFERAASRATFRPASTRPFLPTLQTSVDDLDTTPGEIEVPATRRRVRRGRIE